MRKSLISPCGMNCALCHAYQREKNRCLGCKNEKNIKYKTKDSDKCVIKNCPVIKTNKSGFCFECENFPCTRLKQLDKRYRTKYHMSMIENLEGIKKEGIMNFLKGEKKKWECPNCSKTVCIHKHCCLNCQEKIHDS